MSGRKENETYLPFAVTNVGTSDVFAVEKATHSIAELFDYDPTFVPFSFRTGILARTNSFHAKGKES